MLTFNTFPQELLTKIISFTDVQGILGFVGVDKQTNQKIQEIVSKYLKELKGFYLALTNLQQHYCYKQPKDCEYALNHDNRYENQYKKRVFDGKLVKINVNGSNTHCLELKRKLDDQEIGSWIKIIQAMDMYPHFHQTPKSHENFIKSIVTLIEENVPKDIMVTPILEESYRKEISDDTKNFPYRQIVLTVLPIQRIALQINDKTKISEETQKKIGQSVEWANKHYSEILKPENRNKLEKKINIDELNLIMG